MYEKLESHASAFDDLRNILREAGGATSVDAIRLALEATAREIGEAQGQTQLDRNNLSRLYRGFLAASRMVGHLQEMQAASHR